MINMHLGVNDPESFTNGLGVIQKAHSANEVSSESKVSSRHVDLVCNQLWQTKRWNELTIDLYICRRRLQGKSRSIEIWLGVIQTMSLPITISHNASTDGLLSSLSCTHLVVDLWGLTGPLSFPEYASRIWTPSLSLFFFACLALYNLYQ